MFWMLCISVSESPPFVASWKQTQTTECLPQGSGQRIKKARPSHLRSHLELRTLIPAISTKTPPPVCLLFLNHREFNGGKNCHEAFVQAHLVQVRRAPQPTAAAVLSNLWKPKPSNLGSDAPYSECVWEGERDRDMSDTVNCSALHNLTTSSKPVPNSVWPTSRVAGFFS